MSAGAAAEYLRESGWEDATHTSPSDGRAFVDELGARSPAELRCAQGDALAPLVELRCFAATLSADLRHGLLAVAVDGFDILLANLCPYLYADPLRLNCVEDILDKSCEFMYSTRLDL